MFFKRKYHAQKLNEAAAAAVGAGESINIIAIFASFLRDDWHGLLTTTNKFIFFPLAAAFSIADAVLAWRQVYLEKGKVKRTWGSAILETLTAIGVTAAVVLGFAVTATAGPAILAGVFGTRGLYHLGATGYYGYYRYHAVTGEDKKLLNKLLKQHGLSAFTCLLSTAGFITAMLLGKEACAALGITAASICLLYASYKAFKIIRAEIKAQKRFAVATEQENEDEQNDLRDELKPIPKTKINKEVKYHKKLEKLKNFFRKKKTQAKPSPYQEQKHCFFNHPGDNSLNDAQHKEKPFYQYRPNK